jgi:hypothetical protein
MTRREIQKGKPNAEVKQWQNPSPTGETYSR